MYKDFPNILLSMSMSFGIVKYPDFLTFEINILYYIKVHVKGWSKKILLLCQFMCFMFRFRCSTYFIFWSKTSVILNLICWLDTHEIITNPALGMLGLFSDHSACARTFRLIEAPAAAQIPSTSLETRLYRYCAGITLMYLFPDHNFTWLIDYLD